MRRRRLRSLRWPDSADEAVHHRVHPEDGRTLLWSPCRKRVERIVDIRRSPGGQLSGFAKQHDLAWFLDRLVGADYIHLPELAPSEAIRHADRKDRDWDRYVPRFEAFMDTRAFPNTLDRTSFEEKSSCLLCSEPAPERCHRRLVAERMARVWPDVAVIHLV